MMNITEVFQLISQNIQNDMLAARAVLTHPGMKGAVTEQIVMDFLRKYLPQKLALTSGVLIDSEARITKQLDIIIYDTNKTPTLFLNGGIRVIPVECAYAVIEVKMQLTDLDACIKNMESVKSLKRLAYYIPDSVNIHAMTIKGRQSAHWPETLYFVFAFENKISLTQLNKN